MCGNKHNLQFSVLGLAIREVPGLVITVSGPHMAKRDTQRELTLRKRKKEASQGNWIVLGWRRISSAKFSAFQRVDWGC